MPYGLPHDAALRAVTLYRANPWLGRPAWQHRAGKVANFIITSGDPLAIPTQVRYLFILASSHQSTTDNANCNRSTARGHNTSQITKMVLKRCQVLGSGPDHLRDGKAVPTAATCQIASGV